MKQTYVTCSMCGHQIPANFVRERGWVTCSCGLRIDGGPAVRVHHVVRNVVFLFATALLLALTVSVGRYLFG